MIWRVLIKPVEPADSRQGSGDRFKTRIQAAQLHGRMVPKRKPAAHIPQAAWAKRQSRHLNTGLPEAKLISRLD